MKSNGGTNAHSTHTSTLPPFPYETLKQELLRVPLPPLAVNAPSERQPRLDFLTHLWKEATLVDADWEVAARRVLHTAHSRRPGLARPMRERFFCLRVSAHVSPAQYLVAEPSSAAVELEQWAQDARTALRKITEDYNERFEADHGRLDRLSGISFVAGCIRTEIECLAKSGPGDGQSLSDALGCPVCLRTVFHPVAPTPCGHALCRSCFNGLGGSAANGGTTACCPVCRGPAQRSKPLPVMDVLAKQTNPERYKSGDQEEKLTKAMEKRAQKMARRNSFTQVHPNSGANDFYGHTA